MAARILFLDKGTIDKVCCREDRDEGQNPSNSESEEEEDDESGEQDGSEDKNKEDNWIVGTLKPTRLDLTSQPIKASTQIWQTTLPFQITFISFCLSTFLKGWLGIHSNMQSDTF